ncbi:hypothetical protein PtrSN002B_009967 [Pyrenophora tritici-repentis]|nr:hypothetical protein PtrSN001A_009900 [Pyrenophora tritici-repentis]KAI1527333.1 hypothetical protein PtrSN001C_009894 [Pyrenophora tritici-repentis]KAI1535122.1 hypothetical protein PtrSN002B_009967 [Pyrenophora tritici-repentis]KAI1562387.1 hypothetical protein PtrEW4_010002 [Pyrenophora tritici-repentis]KAI1565344.1 hypothetical protein PtrEW7m1_009924 [Pyrenophora tritici-repentis]
MSSSNQGQSTRPPNQAEIRLGQTAQNIRSGELGGHQFGTRDNPHRESIKEITRGYDDFDKNATVEENKKQASSTQINPSLGESSKANPRMTNTPAGDATGSSKKEGGANPTPTANAEWKKDRIFYFRIDELVG